MLTVKDLNSILSEIFCNAQMTQRSYKPSQSDECLEHSQSFWSVEESAIFTKSQKKENKKSILNKSKLVKDTINKTILLKKFKPINFISGFQTHLEENKNVNYSFGVNRK
jgi:hypothetical protein